MKSELTPCNLTSLPLASAAKPHLLGNAAEYKGESSGPAGRKRQDEASRLMPAG